MWAFQQGGYIVDFRPKSIYYCVPLKLDKVYHHSGGIYSITTKSYVNISVTLEELENYYVKQYEFFGC